MNIKLKSQAFFSDFAVSTLIFVIFIIIYFNYTKNLSNQGNGLDNLLANAETISLHLTSDGYPSNWNSNNVVRVGFTDNGNKINNQKFNEFEKMNYNKSKKLLGTMYDYFIFFLNESGNLTNVEGFCGAGYPEIDVKYDIKAAYYYKDNNNDQFLKSFMENEFNSDVYCKDDDDCPGATLDDLRNNINNYGFVVLEAPEWSVGNQYNPFKPVAESWVDSGGFLMISGELVSGQKKEMVGAAFEKGQGLSSSQERATVVRQDEFLNFEVEQSLIFDQGFTVENAGQAVDFTDIARFNESDIDFDDILNNKIAIARWSYGNGKVFFFSDFDATYFKGNFQENLKASIKKWIGAKCLPFDISKIKRDNLVRVDRLIFYNSKILKMVLYSWN